MKLRHPVVWFFTNVVPHSPLETLVNMYASMIWVSIASNNGLAKAILWKGPMETNLAHFSQIQIEIDFQTTKLIRKCRLQYVNHFVLFSVCTQLTQYLDSMSALLPKQGSMAAFLLWCMIRRCFQFLFSQVFIIQNVTIHYLNTSWLQIRFWYKSNSLRTTQKCHTKYEHFPNKTYAVPKFAITYMIFNDISGSNYASSTIERSLII